ncbi:hypothetical protein P7C71_g2077, partial [Lecanoromycetidae sp. Uapishka_2]
MLFLTSKFATITTLTLLYAITLATPAPPAPIKNPLLEARQGTADYPSISMWSGSACNGALQSFTNSGGGDNYKCVPVNSATDSIQVQGGR